MNFQLPLWCEAIRPEQLTALNDILSAYTNGASIVVMDAPTGAGKTLIAELVRQSLNARALYLCSSLSLQEQFIKDFPYAALIRGRSNYATADNPTQYPELNAGDCQKERTFLPACYFCDPDDTPPEPQLHCQWCHPVIDCPYEQAKRTAIHSDLVCTNTAYFLHEANYVGSLPIARDLIIVDEADLLEDTLLSFVEVSISQRRAKEWQIPTPEKKTVESSWIDWANTVPTHLKELSRHERFKGTTVPAVRQRKALDTLIGNLTRLNDPEHGISSGGWVYTGYDKGDIQFKPITVDHVAQSNLWRHAPRWLLMSATTISFPVLMSSLGL